MPFDLARLRIGYIAGTLGQGGAERQLSYILQALKQSGADVRLYALTRGEFWEEPIRRMGVPVTWAGREPSKAARLRTIYREMRSFRPHIIQTQHFYTNLYAAIPARLLRVADIGAIRSDVFSELRANGPILGPLSLRMPRTIAANSRAAIRNAIASGVPESRLRLLPNVVDTARFHPGHEAADQGPVRLLSVGRLVRAKRYDRLLRVVERLKQRGARPFSVQIAGNGPLEAELREQAREKNLAGCVEFSGAVADLAPTYRAANVLVLTSDHEGTPNVVLEALSTGVPVVATLAGGTADIVQHGTTGLLCPTTDEEALANHLAALISDATMRRRMGAAGREYVSAHHALDQLPRYLSDLYASVHP